MEGAGLGRGGGRDHHVSNNGIGGGAGLGGGGGRDHHVSYNGIGGGGGVGWRGREGPSCK